MANYRTLLSAKATFDAVTVTVEGEERRHRLRVHGGSDAEPGRPVRLRQW